MPWEILTLSSSASMLSVDLTLLCGTVQVSAAAKNPGKGDSLVGMGAQDNFAGWSSHASGVLLRERIYRQVYCQQRQRHHTGQFHKGI